MSSKCWYTPTACKLPALAFVPEKKVKLGMFEVEREREREFQRESSRERERVPEREFQRERAVQREKDSFGSAVKFGPLWFFRSRALAGDAVSAISSQGTDQELVRNPRHAFRDRRRFLHRECHLVWAQSGSLSLSLPLSLSLCRSSTFERMLLTSDYHVVPQAFHQFGLTLVTKKKNKSIADCQ